MTERSAEEIIIAGRQEKAAKLRERGENPFANDTNPETIASVRNTYRESITQGDRYSPEKLLSHGHQHWLVDGQEKCFCGADWVDGRCAKHTPAAPGPHTIAGRIIFMRRIGGATFIRLRDRTGDLQVYCEEKILTALYVRLEDFDLGDIIEASGPMMATIKGELSVQATTLRLLTKSYRPLPTKTGIKDVETRYRHRYVDLLSNPEVASVFKARTHIIRSIRRYLDAADFLEVETPTMQSIPGGALAKPFATHHNALDMDLYMRVAPELYLKRLVVGGFERVYEIGRNYRNEGIDTRHNPEFTELEYYQAYTSVSTLIDQTMDLLRTVDKELQKTLPLPHAGWLATRTFSFDSFVVKTMKDALKAAAQLAGLPDNINELVHGADAPIKDWAKAAKDKGRTIDWSNWRKAAQKCESDGERLFTAYEYLAEPFLVQDYRTADGTKSVPVFITEYPIEVSPLARRIDSNLSFTDRFELFIDGRELCNAFSELNDPADQAERFKAQALKKAGGDEEAMEYDEDYVQALEYGLPPCAGFGMGVDRLVMLLTSSASIRDVIFFPQMRAA